jgi:hypothetical protein
MIFCKNHIATLAFALCHKAKARLELKQTLEMGLEIHPIPSK